MHVRFNRGELLETVVFRIGLLAAIRSKCTKGEPIHVMARPVIPICTSLQPPSVL